MDTVDAALPISVTLTAAQWNTVIGLLAEGAWRVADPLIKEIHRQIMYAAAAAAHAQPARLSATNGAEANHVSD